MNRVVLTVAALALAGCATASPSSDIESDDLKMAECPASLALEVQPVDIVSDDDLLKIYEQDAKRDGYPDPAKAARDQLALSKDWVPTAKAATPASLSGTVGAACHYAMKDTKTGTKSSWSVWLAKSGANDQFQIRMMTAMGRPDDVVYIQVPLTAVSATQLDVDTSKRAKVYAENTSRGHDGTDGFSFWIGSTTVTAKISP